MFTKKNKKQWDKDMHGINSKAKIVFCFYQFILLLCLANLKKTSNRKKDEKKKGEKYKTDMGEKRRI